VLLVDAGPLVVELDCTFGVTLGVDPGVYAANSQLHPLIQLTHLPIKDEVCRAAPEFVVEFVPELMVAVVFDFVPEDEVEDTATSDFWYTSWISGA